MRILCPRCYANSQLMTHQSEQILENKLIKKLQKEKNTYKKNKIEQKNYLFGFNKSLRGSNDGSGAYN